MRFMMLMIPKGYETAEPGTMPDPEAVSAMMKYNEELKQAGVLVALDGLHPPSMGARVSFETGKPTVKDGPFAEAKEVLGGYWIIDVKSKEEAIEWAKRCPASPNETIEIRQVQGEGDFPPEVVEAIGDFTPPGPRHTTSIFVNLPVKDLDRSVEYFKKLGYTFNPQFTDENATCMVVSDTIYVMLLVEDYFKTFTPKPVVDAKSNTEVLVALSLGSREEVDRIGKIALEAGAKQVREPQDLGFMYQWAIEDLDGHVWEYFWMDPAHIEG